jgi:hypothetical protein
MMRTIFRVGLVAVLAMLAGCGPSTPKNQAIYLLLDTSGTYTRELDKMQHIIDVVLARLQPGDAFAVARVDTASFTEKDIVAMVNFDDRPSVANRQKRDFRDHITGFVKTVKPSSYTDITGGMLQAIEHLNEIHPGHKTILIFSDLKEDLKNGYVRDIPLELEGFDVVALNVTKLNSDNIDPREYMDRLDSWRQRVERGGGTWRVINDLENLDETFSY